MPVKYRTSSSSAKIEPVEVVRETEEVVVLAVPPWTGGELHVYHDTWLQARDHLVKRCLVEIQRLQRDLRREQADLEELYKLTPPDLDNPTA